MSSMSSSTESLSTTTTASKPTSLSGDHFTSENIQQFKHLLGLSKGPSPYGQTKIFKSKLNDVSAGKKTPSIHWKGVDCSFGIGGAQDERKKRVPDDELNLQLSALVQENDEEFREFALAIQEQLTDEMTERSKLWNEGKQLTREEVVKMHKHKILRLPKEVSSREKYGEKWVMALYQDIGIKPNTVLKINGSQFAVNEDGTPKIGADGKPVKYTIRDLFDFEKRKGKPGIYDCFAEYHVHFKPSEEWGIKFQIYALNYTPRPERGDPFAAPSTSSLSTVQQQMGSTQQVHHQSDSEKTVNALLSGSDVDAAKRKPEDFTAPSSSGTSYGMTDVSSTLPAEGLKRKADDFAEGTRSPKKFAAYGPDDMLNTATTDVNVEIV